MITRGTDSGAEPHTPGRAGRMNWLRAGVLGADDGIVSVAGIVVGVAGATSSRGAIFTAGEIGSYAAGGLVLMAIAPRTVFQVAGIASTLAALLLGPPAFKASRRAHRRERDL